MRVCGIELKASQIILSVLEKENDELEYIDLKTKKITLEDDENQNNIKKCFESLINFLEENKIEKIYIKKRAKKGTFAGGAVTFKLEALIQLNNLCEVELISSQSISAFEKKNDVLFPDKLKKYQEGSYLVALCNL